MNRMKIRVSSGTASHIGLNNNKIQEKPTTAYLMVCGESEEKCRGGCVFCPQASGDQKWLSRVSWPEFNSDEIIEKIKKSDIQRICLQCPDIEGYEDKIKIALDELKNAGKPISLSSPPIERDTLNQFKETIDRVGIGIDAATDKLREKTKRNYDPKVFWDYMGDAIDIFGKNRVTAHIIVGLGENMAELTTAVYRAVNSGANVSLFAYQNKDHSKRRGIDIDYYRRAQLITHLIEEDYEPREALDTVYNRPETVIDIIEEGEVFKTKGCPGCNRPFYTTRPGEEHKNFPRDLSTEEIDQIKRELGL